MGIKPFHDPWEFFFLGVPLYFVAPLVIGPTAALACRRRMPNISGHDARLLGVLGAFFTLILGVGICTPLEQGTRRGLSDEEMVMLGIATNAAGCTAVVAACAWLSSLRKKRRGENCWTRKSTEEP